MPAKPLTKHQLADAERLRKAFSAWQERRKLDGQPASQDFAANQLGFGQSALSQYLVGRIPLNRQVLVKLANLLDVAPADISPALVEEGRMIETAFNRPGVQEALRSVFNRVRDDEVDRPRVPLPNQKAAVSIAMVLGAAEAIAEHMAGIDAMTREAVAPLLANLALRPDQAPKIASLLERLLSTDQQS